MSSPRRDMAELQPNLWDQVPMLRGRQARAFNEALGEQKDALLAVLREGIKARWTTGARMRAVAEDLGVELTDATTDTKRLDMIGAGFDLPRLGTMGNEAYQEYLENAWAMWEEGGTCHAITTAINAFGIPDVYVVEEWEYEPIPGQRYEKRLTVVLGPDYGSLGWGPLSLPFVINGRSPVGLGIVGATEGQIADLVRLARKWRDAESLLLEMWFLFGSPVMINDPAHPLTIPFTIDGETDSAEVRPICINIIGEHTTLPFIPWGLSNHGGDKRGGEYLIDTANLEGIKPEF